MASNRDHNTTKRTSKVTVWPVTSPAYRRAMIVAGDRIGRGWTVTRIERPWLTLTCDCGTVKRTRAPFQSSQCAACYERRNRRYRPECYAYAACPVCRYANRYPHVNYAPLPRCPTCSIRRGLSQAMSDFLGRLLAATPLKGQAIAVQFLTFPYHGELKVRHAVVPWPVDYDKLNAPGGSQAITIVMWSGSSDIYRLAA